MCLFSVSVQAFGIGENGSLGLFFGLFAGIGFYAVQQGTGMLKTGTDTAVVDEVAAEATTESTPVSYTHLPLLRAGLGLFPGEGTTGGGL